MTIEAFCFKCQKAVEIAADATAFCPVCSSPLIQTVEQQTEGNIGAGA
ncbi:MAG: hypothetical protein QOG54_758 [Actinomycetota bacterium]|jgi:DNA-directed RNA polymerase subunit RPC12/RpoP|nr:hypothetical protein [Actinomycetota bacterium]